MIETAAFKIAGSVLIIGSTTLAGIVYSKKDGYREKQLMEMKSALTIFKNEIRFGLSTFGEAALSVAEKVGSPAADIFAHAGRNAVSKNGGAASVIWEKAVKSGCDDSYFTDEDINSFISMGNSIGILDKEMQENAISLLIEYIDGAAASIREKSAGQPGLYKSLGFLGGLLVTVILL